MEHDRSRASLIAPAIRMLLKENAGDSIVVFVNNTEVARCLQSARNFARVSTSFTPGHLVYGNHQALFVQYMKAGKVPGAKTVRDVRKYYEAKVPMGRGCTPEDVTRAVLYLVEQEYETGQALPITGG